MTTVNDEKSIMMRKIQELSFTIVDLNLYLDTHLYDSFAINQLNTVTSEYRELMESYNEKFGPLILYNGVTDTTSWQWALQDFPWDY